VVDELEPVGDGTYRTSEPIPVHGEWKTLIRLHSGKSLYGLPVYLPEDEAIPAEEVPARPSFEREFVADHTILQREQKAAAPGLTAIAYGTVLGIALSLLGLLAWGLHRLTTAVTRGQAGPSLHDRLRDAAGALFPRPARRLGALAGRRSGVS
jgi:hypothetical protein